MVAVCGVRYSLSGLDSGELISWGRLRSVYALGLSIHTPPPEFWATFYGVPMDYKYRTKVSERWYAQSEFSRDGQHRKSHPRPS
jgi:hypothetical protein